MSDSPQSLLARLIVVVLLAGLGRARPNWLVPAVLAAVPLQLGIFPDVELATLGWVHWHNTERLHGYLDDVPHAEFETAHYIALATTSEAA